jgi:urocanate hydratase
VHAFYQALVPWCDSSHALGGRLVYAGELSGQASQLIRAANIAGAASLTVSAAPGDLREAMRSGVIDFIVTSLDEALRILKNEIRKQQAVAVGVRCEPAEMGHEMMLRGVQPDLLMACPAAILPLCARTAFLERGAQPVEPAAEDPQSPLHIWPVPAAWNARLNELDTKLLGLLPADAMAVRRWLRLSPRYLGHAARRVRSAACHAHTAHRLQDLLQ